MKIKSLKITSYKSFADSGWIDLAPKFNVIVGKNSSGKTAFLEAFKLEGMGNKPHLSEARRPNNPAPPSRADVKVSLDSDELIDALQRMGTMYFPIPANDKTAAAMVTEFFRSTNTVQVYASQGSLNSVSNPSHGIFEGSQGLFVAVSPNHAKQSYTISEAAGGGHDSVANLFAEQLRRKLYVFRAQRLNIGEIAFSEETILADNAANLPRVLFSMSTNPALFERYNRHVNQIFPYIKLVTPFPKGTNIDVRIWWAVPKSERADLTVPLQESGTGVSQALAILYVAMTIDRGVIVIDEPNSFLHPGAAKTLIEILRQYDHQYIMSTHSPEIVAAARPDSVKMMKWENGNTGVIELDKIASASQRKILAELGVSAADVFGSESVIWVEGPTEAECFPLLLQAQKGFLDPGTDFVAVRSVDEIVRKQGTDEAVMDIYQKLTDVAAVLPKAIHFSFDRERRSQEYIDKVQVASRGKVRFLPARCYECFLIDVNALTAIIAAEALVLGKPVPTKGAVQQWLMENAESVHSVEKWGKDLTSVPWVKGLDAPELLNKLFRHFILMEYDKVRHSRALTEWLLENDRDHLRELMHYVEALTIE